MRADVERHHRLEFENVLRAVVRPEAEIGIALERQDGEIADRILQFFRDVRLVGLAPVGDGLVVLFGGDDLLGVRGRSRRQTHRKQRRDVMPKRG